MRRCKISTGCKLPDKPCCADCRDRTCPARCRNAPQRCGCVEEGPPPRARERHGGTPRKVDRLKVAWLRAQGYSIRRIADDLGCSKTTVCKILHVEEMNENGKP